MTPQKLERYLKRFERANVLVVGDMILDHYIWGQVHRVSPEAPVPVVHVSSESLSLGGAANVFKNVISLGGQADLCGVIGADESGRSFLKELAGFRPNRGGVTMDAKRPTTRKTRIIAHNQQIVRYDIEEPELLSPSIEKKILRYVRTRLPEVTCLVISDYDKGVITPSLMTHLRSLAARHRVPIVVDPKVKHFEYYSDVTVITPNHVEAYQAAGLRANSNHPIDEVGPLLRKRLNCKAVLVTRGEHGMSLFEENQAHWHIPAMARQVYDVTGAGDTVVSTLALAISAGANIKEAAVLANRAAGVVVGMLGTASVTPIQLKDALYHA
jgi:D-beta-D-heptose 7-phosphate kinase/D-beta-D-heptose 1-phosphate adenosyltransferase